MKKCPNCNQTFTDDNIFCQNDGTTLLFVENTGENTPSFPMMSNSAPTQIVSRPTTVSPNSSKDSSKWLYMIIGILATALAGLAIFMFLPREKSEKAENTNQNSKMNENTNQAENVLAKDTPQNLPSPANTNVSTPKPINPNLSPGGNWSGNWSSKTTDFTATANFTESGGKVGGQIVWTLRRTTNQKKIGKEGASATEYIQGTYNAATRMISIEGYRLDDPYGIVVKDKYTLVLAENNLTMTGGSRSNGKFVLRR
jgi:hypothetical protein